MSNPLVVVENLQKSYESGPERLTILDELAFQAQEGSSVIILGESGSGKSTLLNLIGGLDLPDSGSVRIRGREITTFSENELSLYRMASVGFVFQFHYLLNDFTALENVMLPRYMGGASRPAATDRAKELLREVDLLPRSNHYPHQLSGGERQRVAVARALVNDPDIILADEPTGNLDERHSDEIEELIFNLVETYGKTLILVTHDLDLASRGDARYLLHNGALVRK
ncbi:MAG: lipoprotein-releasing system ATP-binding protein LolD [Spirochaetales bacterium]|nr:lipoprotein-releasing system ATP-binding protein LolD [Spirochaetales bacterium]